MSIVVDISISPDQLRFLMEANFSPFLLTAVAAFKSSPALFKILSAPILSPSISIDVNLQEVPV
jgi:hypothetical protein